MSPISIYGPTIFINSLSFEQRMCFVKLGEIFGLVSSLFHFFTTQNLTKNCFINPASIS